MDIVDLDICLRSTYLDLDLVGLRWVRHQQSLYTVTLVLFLCSYFTLWFDDRQAIVDGAVDNGLVVLGRSSQIQPDVIFFSRMRHSDTQIHLCGDLIMISVDGNSMIELYTPYMIVFSSDIWVCNHLGPVPILISLKFLTTIHESEQSTESTCCGVLSQLGICLVSHPMARPIGRLRYLSVHVVWTVAHLIYDMAGWGKCGPDTEYR